MTDPPFSTEKEALQDELRRRYHNLAILKNREAMYGLNSPLQLIHEIEQERERIAEIEARLKGLTNEPSAAAQYFSAGTRGMISGEYWEAKRQFELCLYYDPYYPRAKELLTEVERKIGLRENENEVKEVIQLGPHWRRIVTLVGIALVILVIVIVVLWITGFKL